MFDLFRMLVNETMKSFCVRIKNKSKHKFVAMKVCKTIQRKEIFKS